MLTHAELSETISSDLDHEDNMSYGKRRYEPIAVYALAERLKTAESTLQALERARTRADMMTLPVAIRGRARWRTILRARCGWKPRRCVQRCAQCSSRSSSCRTMQVYAEFDKRRRELALRTHTMT